MFCEKKKNWINECTCALKENTPEGFIHGAGGGVEGHSKGARVPMLVLWASRTLGSTCTANRPVTGHSLCRTRSWASFYVTFLLFCNFRFFPPFALCMARNNLYKSNNETIKHDLSLHLVLSLFSKPLYLSMQNFDTLILKKLFGVYPEIELKWVSYVSSAPSRVKKLLPALCSPPSAPSASARPFPRGFPWGAPSG